MKMADDIVVQSITARQFHDDFGASNAAGPVLMDEAVTETNPTVCPNRADTNTGMAWKNTDQLTLVAGGVVAMKFAESSTSVLQAVDASVGLTAHVGSAQGNGPISCTYNVYSTVANAGGTDEARTGKRYGMVSIFITTCGCVIHCSPYASYIHWHVAGITFFD